MFGSEIEDGIYHLASDRVSAEEYFKTACRVKNYVSVDGDAIFVDLPQNLSKALTLRLVNEIENHLNKISNTHFLKIFVNTQGVSEGLDSEIYEFLNKFDRFL